MIPDWQLPVGVDRGLWDYFRSSEMVGGYDAQMAASPLAAADVRFCEATFPTPGRLVDLGCGTGRLAVHFAAKGFECVGVDLSAEMLAQAGRNAATAGVAVGFLDDNLVELGKLPDGSFDYAACLFSTLGMVRGSDNRAAAVRSAFRVLKPGGRFVLHVHNRFFRGLGWKRTVRERWKHLCGAADAGDITMPQGYGGAPLTLHHFTRSEAVALLETAGFAVEWVDAVTDTGETAARDSAAYGYLIAAQKPG